MILGGAFLAYLLSICTYFVIRSGSWLIAIIPAVVAFLGILWVVIGILSLARRRQRAIIIEETGITIPQGSLFAPKPSLLISRAAIVSISKHESIHGRLIEIALAQGGKISIQAWQYCELKTFLNHCKAHDLPVIS